MSKTVHYQIDTQKSLFTVHPFATGLATTLSHGLTISIRDFIGELQFVPSTLDMAAVHMTIKTDSLAVTDEMKESDCREVERAMKEDVLRVSQNPEIEFKSSSIRAHKTMENHYRLEIMGDLALNGVIRAHSFEAQVVFAPDSLRAHGKFETRQTDYGIPLISAAGGLIKVRDEVKFNFYIVARKLA